MPKTEFPASIRDHLADLVSDHTQPTPQPLNVSQWVAMSILQKAIRRGQTEYALNAAATLLRDAPDRLWKRLGVIAFEDVGLGDPKTAALVTGALIGKSYRSQIGGEWHVASYLVTRLAKARKCRAADDLLFTLTDDPANVPIRLELGELSNKELACLITGSAPLATRAIALRCLVGTNRWNAPEFIPRRGDPDTAFDLLIDAGVPHGLIGIAAESFKKTGEPLGPMVALLSREQGWKDAAVVDDIMPPEVLIGHVPGWALDKFTREGKAALSHFIGTGSKSAKWLGTHVTAGKRLGVLGKVLFVVESSLMRSRIRWATGDQLRHQAELECLGVPNASELLELLRSDLPQLNEIRSQTFRGEHSVSRADAGGLCL